MRTLFGCLILSLSASALALNRPYLPPEAVLGDKLADSTPTQISVGLRLEDQEGARQLIADQQDPKSSSYHQWLTPQQFGERFGLPKADYERVARWLEAAGFTVTRFPNRLYLTASGTVHHTRRLLGIEPHTVYQWGRTFRTYIGDPVLPADIDRHVDNIVGLDTRIRWHHRTQVHQHIADTNSETGYAFGAPDFRVFYDFASFFTANATSGTLETAVIATQAEGSGSGTTPPSAADINQYISTVSQGGVTYNPITLSNSSDDYDSSEANLEYELDAEMQSVGGANLSKINMVLAPNSTVMTDAPNWIVNNLPNVVTASSSLGICEPDLNGSGFEGSTTEALFTQGLMQGITWFAAAGDEGADDCYSPEDGITRRGGNNGGNSGGSSGGSSGNGGSASVDWPCSMTEIVCMGGTQLDSNPTSIWSGTNSTLTGYLTEDVWNETDLVLNGMDVQGGAGGGGVSILYTKPSWQTASTPADGYRDVPDLALQAATYSPGVALYDDNYGTTALDVVGGTSVASPLGAGLFALISSRVGCRLGDVHPNLYTLGAAQKSGGAAVFHDIVTGNNSNQGVTGFTAAAGYDQASGWGSLDVAALVASWPSCTGTTTSTTSTGTTSTGTTATGTSSTSGTTASGTSTTSSTTSSSSSSSSGGSCAPATATVDNGDLGAACTGSGQGSCTATGETCVDLFGDGNTSCWATCSETSSTCPEATGICTPLSSSNGSTVYYCLPACEPSVGTCPGGLACNPYTPDPTEYGYCFLACQSASDCNSGTSAQFTCSPTGACLCTQDSDCVTFGAGNTCDPTSGACYTSCTNNASCSSSGGCCATEGSADYCDPFGTVESTSGTTGTGTGTTASNSSTGTATATNASSSSGATNGSSSSGAVTSSGSGSGSGSSGATVSGSGSSGSGSHGATTSASSSSGASGGSISNSGSGSSGAASATNGGTTFSTTGAGGNGGGCSTGGGELSLLPLIGLVALRRRRRA